MAEKKHIFTPAGGMNQDDSVITPAKETGGRSLFELGDYRYALHARLGGRNVGDAENIKDTAEVTAYYRKSQIFENPTFDGTIAQWSQLDDGPGFTAWAWGSYLGVNYARLNSASGIAFTSQVLYQTGFSFGETITLRIAPPNPDLYIVPLTGSISIVFLNGTSIVQETQYEISEFVNGFLRTLDVPDGCDGIGMRIQGSTESSFSAFSWSIAYLYGFSWTTATAPTGTEKTIGKFEDKEFLRYYYCNWNSYGNHTIRMYDYSTDRVYELLQWSGLNWESTDFVKMAKLDNWLAITDRRNKPRLIDTDDITDLFLRLGEDEFREFHISFHKWAPVLAPVLKRVYNTGDRNEELYRKPFDFCYRYIYYGNLRSRWSPIAVCHGFLADRGSTASTISYIELLIPGLFLDQPSEEVSWNYFDHSDQKFLQAVEYIEIAYREGDLDLWKTFKRKKTNDGVSNSSFQFRNNGFIGFVPKEDLYQPQDTVPLKAGTVESADNRFVFGDCQNEYPYWNEILISDISIASIRDASSILNSWISTATGPGFIEDLNHLLKFNFKERAAYKLGIQWLYPEGRKSLVYTQDDWVYQVPSSSNKDDTNPVLSQSLSAFAFKIVSTCQPPEDAVAYQIVRSNAIGIDSFVFGVVNKFTALVDDVSTQMEQIADTESSILDRLTSHFENAKLIEGFGKDAKISNGEYEITEKLSDVLKVNPLAYKLLGFVRKTKSITAIQYASRISINVNNWYNASKDNGTDRNNPVNKIFYNFRVGDRCRFVGSEVASPSESQKKIYDVLILEFTGTSIIIEKPVGLLWIGTSSGTIGSNYVIEIYSPVTTRNEDVLFFETGECYPVLYPGTELRDFSKRDFTWTNIGAATSTTLGNGLEVYNKIPFYKGDCYLITMSQRFDFVTSRGGASGNFISIFLTSMTPFTDSIFGHWDKRNGRISLAYSSIPNVGFFTTQCRFGGKIVEESLINQINRFKEEDQFIYPSEYGRIRNLVNTSNAQVESVGTILLAIGEREAWSIYVNRTTLEDLSGRTQVAISDKVLGSYNTLLGSHGTLNPESVSSERGRVWWWDAIDGTWCRYGRDGVTEISFYKMRTWFRDLGRLLITKYSTDEVPLVISDFDTLNEELVVFQNHSSLPETFRGYDIYKGAIFSEEDTRWKFIHNWTPERIGKIETQLLSWAAGRLYKHEAGENYNTFYGVKEDVKIEPICNQEPMNMKSWQSIAVTATHGWSVERFLSEYRGAKTEQESVIPLTSFEEKEDTFFAFIKNDQNSVNVSDPIINGKKMRSKALRALLKLDPSVVTLSLLHFVTFGYIDSPKNP
jgi:hypothetical protein